MNHFQRSHLWRGHLITVHPRPFHQSLAIPSSKSYANRFLILASLNKNPVAIHHIPSSSDVLSLISCLEKIGLDIKRDKDTVIIENSFPECEKDSSTIHLSTGDGGTTNRFLIPLLGLGSRRYCLHAAESMQARPMDEEVLHLQRLGVTVSRENSWFSLQGPIRHLKDLCVDCSISTQFASGLLLALSKLAISVTVKNIKTSQWPYWELSKKVFKDRESRSFNVPVDFSSMSYPLALGGHRWVRLY